ncbi:TIGR01212 family radical SAM protein [Geothermobacter hydrogeniphilus]|uniref:TIGR01212 family radical SAM protein n=1 Tax=Geothermobacter hydrogeniphilus TaxID=1969733 RepID=A0A2K2H7M0_9BACT|nr:TIGR01212 family radical SAM protein [Geothermobacter hydrogeniphilus]PNU19314.1 TIGR01212 family radical SAM protein [Geothermobacter hydrogeniphilus]
MRSKRYNLFSEDLKQRFGGRVHKISVDAGFGCPHRDGGRRGGGCIFCDPGGSGSFGLERRLSVRGQIEAGKEVMTRKYKAKHFMAYFQPFSNTFAPVARLRTLYDEALAVADVIGFAVGTRPDCLPDEVLDLLADYHRRTCFWLEIGLQSSHDATLEWLRRGHDYACFLDSYRRAKERGLKVCVHVILGLPGESRRQVLQTADEMARLRVDGIKLHLLHVMKGTVLGERYRAGEFRLLERDEYVTLVCDVLERLHPTTLIHRLTGDGPRDYLLAPLWSLKKWEVLNAIDAELERRGTRQGSRVRKQEF